MADARERLIRISSQIGDDETANRARSANGGNLVVSASAQRELTNAARVEAKKWIHDVEDRCRRVLLNALGSDPYDQELIAIQLGDVVRSYLEAPPRGEQFAARRTMKVADKAKREEYERTKMPYLKALRTGRIIDDAIAGEVARSKNKRLSAGERAEAAYRAAKLKAAKAGKGKPPKIARKWETTHRTGWNRSYNRGILRAAYTNDSVRYLQWHTARELHLGGGPVCEVCEGYELLTLPKDHPRWGTHAPPLHYNCRCMLVEVTDAMAREYGIKATTKKEQPDWEGDHEPAEGFGG
jgi:hypothetical protein